jgi:hypothetical protein
LRIRIMLNKIDADGVQVDNTDESAWSEISTEAFAGKREEEGSTHHEAGVTAVHGEGTEGGEMDVLSARAGVEIDWGDGRDDEVDDRVGAGAGLAGLKGPHGDGEAGWFDGHDGGIGADVEGAFLQGTTGEDSKYGEGSYELLGGKAEAYMGFDKASLGAQANLASVEGRLGGDGNQIEAGLSAGLGLGAEARYGEDSDNDGYGEWGARVEAGPVALGFKVEPGKIVDDVAGAASDALDFLNPFD